MLKKQTKKVVGHQGGREVEVWCILPNLWPQQTGGEEGMYSSFSSRVARDVGDTALTGVVGAHVGDSDYPQGKDV